MSTDWYTRLVLTVLTVLVACAVALAAYGLRGSSGSAEEGRYRIQIVPMARMILKFDSDTGKAWRTNFPDPKVWLPIADEPVDTLDDEAPEEGDEGDDVEESEESEETAPEPASPAPPAP